MYTHFTMPRPWLAAAYSAGVNEWSSGSSFLTQLRRILDRSQRCWWVSTTGNILGVSLAAAAAATVAPAAERNSRRFIAVALRGGRRGLYPEVREGERRRRVGRDASSLRAVRSRRRARRKATGYDPHRDDGQRPHPSRHPAA